MTSCENLKALGERLYFQVFRKSLTGLKHRARNRDGGEKAHPRLRAGVLQSSPPLHRELATPTPLHRWCGACPTSSQAGCRVVGRTGAISTDTAHAASSIKHLHFSERADPQLQGTAVYDEVRREAGSIVGLQRASCQHTGDRGRKPGQTSLRTLWTYLGCSRHCSDHPAPIGMRGLQRWKTIVTIFTSVHFPIYFRKMKKLSPL